VTGPFVNRNSFGTFLAFGVVLALAMTIGHFVEQAAEADREGRGRASFDPIVLIYALCFAITLAALLLTHSRMAVFAALCGSLVVVLLNLWRLPNRWLALLVLLPVGVGGAAAAIYLYGEGLVERLGTTEDSFQVRFALYQQVVDMIRLRPWTGYGAGSFAQAFQLIHQPPVNTNLVWDKAHDTYLALWAELGLVLGSIPLALVGLALIRTLFGLRRVRADWTSKVAAIGVVIVGAVHSLADFSLEIPGVAMLFTAMLALGVSGIARRSNEPAGGR
jgi:O-antigen ligase